VDPRRTHQGIGWSLEIDILSLMLEIDIEPRQWREEIGHRSSGRCRGPHYKDKRYVGSLSDEGSMHVVCMTHEGATHVDNPRRR